jgi:hypothetical protein
MFSLKAHQSENKIISVLKLSCKDDFNQAKFNKYNVHVQPIGTNIHVNIWIIQIKMIPGFFICHFFKFSCTNFYLQKKVT